MSLPNIAAPPEVALGAPANPVRQAMETRKAPAESYWRKLVPRSLPQIFLLALVVLVASLQLRYLLSVRAAMPLQDDWSFLDKMFRAFDRHEVAAWVFDSTNGHFVVPGALASLASWRYFSLDLTALRLLNFPICLAAFFLAAHVINANVQRRFLRFYLYAGAAFIIFNLCFWEHFAQANGFSAMLCVLCGSIGIYYVSKATLLSAPWKSSTFFIGLVFLLISVFSLGAGYAAVMAGACLVGFTCLERMSVFWRTPRYNRIVLGVVCAVAALVVVSHPALSFSSRIVKAAFHTVLVAGSLGSASLDKGTNLAQNVAFASGLAFVVVTLWICFHFLVKRRPSVRPLPVFSMGLILFGFLGCVAVAIARAYLPTAEFLNSRYTPYPSLILLGTLLYFAGSRLFLLANVWCFAAAAYLLASVREDQLGFFRAQLYQRMTTAISNADSLSDEQLKTSLYWRENPKGVRRVITRMRRDQVNVFRGGAGGSNSVP
jgi:hypothetical protein